MRLLSFVADIERALLAESPAVEGGAWLTQRMVNFQHGLARLSLMARSAADCRVSGGAIFVQAFALADGSTCLKASLNWRGSEALPVIAIYSTPNLNWTVEARRVAAAWLQGPPVAGAITTTEIATQPVSSLTAVAS